MVEMSGWLTPRLSGEPSCDNLPLCIAKIGIIGWGVVGQAVGKGFETKGHQIFWYSRKPGPYSLNQVINKSEFIFLCLPTPMFSDYSGIDLSIIDEVVSRVAPKISGTDKILIIKSTVIPGTTASYKKKYPKNRTKHCCDIVQHCNYLDTNWNFFCHSSTPPFILFNLYNNIFLLIN